MIGLASSTKGSVQAIDYILNDKGKAIELDRNLVSGNNGKEILNEFRIVQEMNNHCTKNTISLVISPNPEDSKNMTPKQFLDITHKHLDNLGLKDNQWIATIHPSTGKPHIHIIANRIDKNGKALNDSFIGKKAQSSAAEIANEMGFKTAKEIQKEKTALIKQMNKPLINEIKTTHFNVIKMCPKNLKDYESKMKEAGIIPQYKTNKQGNIQGMKFLHLASDTLFKASDIHKLIRYDKLIASIALKLPQKIISKGIEISR